MSVIYCFAISGSVLAVEGLIKKMFHITERSGSVPGAIRMGLPSGQLFSSHLMAPWWLVVPNPFTFD
uniref:Putative secreted peptide n=1 Tax=Anopheles braziliensis TaxID=58242 RepID=A0A2M3ZX78_9DIPT